MSALRCAHCAAPIIHGWLPRSRFVTLDAEPVAGGVWRCRAFRGTHLAEMVGATLDLFDDGDDGTRWAEHRCVGG